MVVCRTSVFIKWNNSLIRLQMKDGSILIVDENIETLQSFLANHFEKVTATTDPEKARMLVTKQIFDVVLLDINISKSSADGNALLDDILKNTKGISVILLNAQSDQELAMAAVNKGAIDYIQKPWDNQKLLNSINTGIRLRRQAIELETLKQQQQGLISSYQPMDQLIVGESTTMRQVIDTIKKVASTNASVILLGENGTGKSLAAAEIHRLSGRRNGPFVSVDLGSLNENIFESELFGHVKGAFTDAKEERIGRVEAAHGGTLFLDEIGELPLLLQTKLLRVLQEREFRRVGDSVIRKTDVRVLTASNRDLQEQVAAGSFREDLYYRINVVQVIMPPLRDRIEDIPLLIEHFFQKYCDQGHTGETITPSALKLLMNYPFPGNIRELENVVERSLILDRTIISEGSLPEQVRSARTPFMGSEVNIPDEGMALEPLLEDLEKRYLLKALDKTGGAKKKAADLLGMSFRSFRYRLAKFGLDSGDE